MAVSRRAPRDLELGAQGCTPISVLCLSVPLRRTSCDVGRRFSCLGRPFRVEPSSPGRARPWRSRSDLALALYRFGCARSSAGDLRVTAPPKLQATLPAARFGAVWACVQPPPSRRVLWCGVRRVANLRPLFSLLHAFDRPSQRGAALHRGVC